jgi:hypothetical protein
MKIKKLDYEKLRNEEHFQFHTDLVKLIENETPAKLKVVNQFVAYRSLYDDENTALNVILKSGHTKEMAETDVLRDERLRGFRLAASSFTTHFLESKRKAADRILIVLDKYNGIELKPYDQETASVNQLLAELTGTLAADIAFLGLSDWPIEIKTTNDAFADLMTSRFTEGASKTDLQMKVVRTAIDKVCRTILDRIDAVILLDEETDFSSFVNELNARIDRASLVLAQRQGRNSKGDDKTTPTA